MEPIEDIARRYHKKLPMSRSDLINLIQEMNKIICDPSPLQKEIDSQKELLDQREKEIYTLIKAYRAEKSKIVEIEQVITKFQAFDKKMSLAQSLEELLEQLTNQSKQTVQKTSNDVQGAQLNNDSDLSLSYSQRSTCGEEETQQKLQEKIRQQQSQLEFLVLKIQQLEKKTKELSRVCESVVQSKLTGVKKIF